MSLEQCQIDARIIMHEQPRLAKWFKGIITDLYDHGFKDQTVGDLYQTFVNEWIEHTYPKD